MATSYDAFLGNVMPHVNGCSRTIALDAVRDATIALCKKGRIWMEELTPINGVLGQASYSFVTPAGSVVSTILQAFYSGKEIFPIDIDSANQYYLNWLTITGQPKHYTQFNERAIRLIPIPQEALTAGIKLIAALEPTKTSTTVEDRIYEEYDNVVATGALAYLLLMPKTPGREWPDAQLGAINAAKFQDSIDMARSRSNKSYVRSRKRVKGVFF